MKIISFTVPGVPVAKGRARSARTKFGKTIHYTPKKTKVYENEVCKYALLAMYGGKAIEESVRLTVFLYMPIPKSWSLKKKALALSGEILPTTKPDLDNMVKLIGDAMNGVVYKDDSQIVWVTARKFYTTEPRAIITVETI